MSSGSPFIFPHGNSVQALHGMGVQSRRAAKELPASVRDSLLPIIPVFSVQTKAYARVSAGIQDFWMSDVLSVPVSESGGRSISFVSMDGTSVGNELMLTWQIMRNDVVVCVCDTQNAFDGLGNGDAPHQYGIWAGPVEPGDRFRLRCGLGNGPAGSAGSSADVTFTLTSIRFRQSNIR